MYLVYNLFSWVRVVLYGIGPNEGPNTLIKQHIDEEYCTEWCNASRYALEIKFARLSNAWKAWVLHSSSGFSSTISAGLIIL